jgi:hypothetical protein
VTTLEEALAALREQWGERWEVWVVRLALGGERWCARRHGGELRNVLHADTPGHLAEYITEAEAEAEAEAASDEAP